LNADGGPNELALMPKCESTQGKLLERAGLKDIVDFDNKHEMGYGINEMELPEWGKTPKTLRSEWMHNSMIAKNVIWWTDGASMLLPQCVQSLLTYMAFDCSSSRFLRSIPNLTKIKISKL